MLRNCVIVEERMEAYFGSHSQNDVLQEYLSEDSVLIRHFDLLLQLRTQQSFVVLHFVQVHFFLVQVVQ